MSFTLNKLLGRSLSRVCMEDLMLDSPYVDDGLSMCLIVMYKYLQFALTCIQMDIHVEYSM